LIKKKYECMGKTKTKDIYSGKFFTVCVGKITSLLTMHIGMISCVHSSVRVKYRNREYSKCTKMEIKLG